MTPANFVSVPVVVILAVGLLTYFGIFQRGSRLAAHYHKRVNAVLFLLVNSVATYLLHLLLQMMDITDYNWLSQLALFWWFSGLTVIIFSLPQHRLIRYSALTGLLVSVVFIVVATYQNTTAAELLSKLDNLTIGQAHAAMDNVLRPSNLLMIIFYFLNCFLLAVFFVYAVRDYNDFRARAGSTQAFKVDALNNILAVCSALIATILALALSGVDLKIVAIITGLISAGAAAVLKDLLTNVAAGTALLVNRDIKEKDVLNIDGFGVGVVERMGLRYTVFKNRDDVRVLVPNSVIFKNPITHLTLEGERRTRLYVEVGVDYSADIRQAKALMTTVCHYVDRVLASPAPTVQTKSFNDFDITLKLCFWISDPEKGIGNVKSQVFDFILERFREHEINIPYPRVDYQVLDNVR